MPHANAPAPELTIAVPRVFVESVNAFASEWLVDFHDYANDDFGDETEQAAREQELALIRSLSETSDALLQPAQSATPEQFRQWLNELARFNPLPTIGPVPDDPTKPGATGLRVNLNTALFSYAIAARWYTDEHGNSRSYLGAIAARHGNGGRDLADGPVSAETWRSILEDIVALEMSQYQAPAPEPELAHARERHGYPPDVKAAYEPNGDLIISLVGDTAGHVAQRAQAAQLTTEQYLYAKLGRADEGNNQPPTVPATTDDPDTPT